jgi:hypothetical protein
MFTFVVIPPFGIDIIEKILVCKKKYYDVFYWVQKVFPPLLSFSLGHTPSLFLNEIMNFQVLNKIVYPTMKKFNSTLKLSIYNKYKEGMNFLIYKLE